MMTRPQLAGFSVHGDRLTVHQRLLRKAISRVWDSAWLTMLDIQHFVGPVLDNGPCKTRATQFRTEEQQSVRLHSLLGILLVSYSMEEVVRALRYQLYGVIRHVRNWCPTSVVQVYQQIPSSPISNFIALSGNSIGPVPH